MKNAEIRKRIQTYNIEWEEVARAVKVPMADFTRRMNSKELSPLFQQRVIDAIERIGHRPESFYYD